MSDGDYEIEHAELAWLLDAYWKRVACRPPIELFWEDLPVEQPFCEITKLILLRWDNPSEGLKRFVSKLVGDLSYRRRAPMANALTLLRLIEIGWRCTVKESGRPDVDYRAIVLNKLYRYSRRGSESPLRDWMDGFEGGYLSDVDSIYEKLHFYK